MFKRVAAALAVSILALAACEQDQQEERQSQNVQDEQVAINANLENMLDAQPVPKFDWSQERQVVIDTETIRATGNASTTIFYLEGIGMVNWCPSLGSPVPSTYQLTGSEQYVDIPGDATSQKFPVDQQEPTGTYVGESAATWTVCLDDNGRKFGVYWEAPVASIIGTIDDLDEELRIQPTDLTFEFAVEDSE